MDSYDSEFCPTQEQEAPAYTTSEPWQTTADCGSAPAQDRTIVPPQGEQPAAPRTAPQADYSAFQVGADGTYRYQPRQAEPVRTSPYANSPYMNAPAADAYRYQPRTTPPAKKPRKKSGAWTVVISALLAIVLAFTCSFGTAAWVNRRWEARNRQAMDAMQQQVDAMQQQLDSAQTPSQPNTPAPSTSGHPALSTGKTPAQVYSETYASVVTVRSTTKGLGQSTGSGFVLTEDGYVITNAHVIEDATSVEVVLHDDTSLPATIAGYDTNNDVAVLKIDGQDLSPVKLGSSTDACVGDMVVAIGNPLGELNFTQTVGYICGKDREVTTGGTILSMLQIDAAINPGNSGGPLFNMNGEVIGITTAKFSGTLSSGASIEGIGFAIPIDDVIGIVNDLKDHGYVTGAYMGVTVQNLSDEFISTFGTSGVLVLSVEPDFAANRAGLRAKDIIIAMDGVAVHSITDVGRILRNYKAGDTVMLTVIRSFEKLEMPITLDEKPRPDDATPSP